MAELALAIIPLGLVAIKGAIKGAKSVSKTTKTLRHHDRKIRRLQTLFKVQRDFFLDEFQIIFQQILGADVAEALVKEPGHPAWNDELESKMRSYFGARLEDLQAVASEIHVQIEGLDKTLNATLGDKARPDVKLKGLENKQEAASFVLHEADYESQIEELGQWVQDLRKIREVAMHINASKTRSFANTERPRKLPTWYHQVTKYSSSFHRALVSSWSCRQVHHTNHDVRLLLEKGQDDTSFRVAIHYEAQPGGDSRDGLLGLVVSSQSTNALVQRLSMTKSLQEPPPVQTRVRAAGVATKVVTQHAESSHAFQTEAGGHTTFRSINLCSSKDMCTQLCTYTVPPRPGQLYLESHQDLRHYLRTACDISCSHNNCFSLKGFGEPAPLDSILSFPPHGLISMGDQLRLALRLVKGVLQFQSTPWLRKLWGLGDLSYFQTDAGLGVALNTLHVSAQLSPQKSPDVITESLDLQDAQLESGIRNLMMHSLGVALLQIGRWKALDLGDIVNIRRLVEHESPLGPMYRSITQRCFECDFGHRCGKDLSREELRHAVYEDVVCELEGLILSLERGSHRADTLDT